MTGNQDMPIRTSCAGAASAIGALLVLAAPVGVSAASMKAELSVAPEAFAGHCPADLVFTGRIVVEGPLDPSNPVGVAYAFMRSDGGEGPTQYLMVGKAGEYPVSSRWSLGLDHYKGWQQLKVWPTRTGWGLGYVFSPRAEFSISCQ